MSVYEYHEIGFQGVRLLSGFEAGNDAGGPYLELAAPVLLHQEIMKALCTCDVDLTGPMVYAFRTELELTQRDLGRELGLEGRQMLSFYERGMRPVPLTTQHALKRKLLAKVAGASTSVGIFDRQLSVEAPKTFDFVFNGSSWIWANSPHMIAPTFQPPLGYDKSAFFTGSHAVVLEAAEEPYKWSCPR